MKAMHSLVVCARHTSHALIKRAATTAQRRPFMADPQHRTRRRAPSRVMHERKKGREGATQTLPSRTTTCPSLCHACEAFMGLQKPPTDLQYGV